MELLKKSKQGFTLIEVVIVLAIAALILVIVIFAIAGAQRAQRDTKTKDAAAKTLAAAEQYAGNNGGTYPTTQAQLNNYLTNVKAGDGSTPNQSAAPSSASSSATVVWANSATCSGSGYIAGGNSRQMAVSYYSEAGGQAYCISN